MDFPCENAFMESFNMYQRWCFIISPYFSALEKCGLKQTSANAKTKAKIYLSQSF